MKKGIFLSVILFSFLALPGVAKADDLAARLKGRILLQVETNGEAWYVSPENEERYYLGRPDDAFQLMRELGLGVSNVDFANFGEYAPARLAGRILLKVEANGEAYYVNPVDLKMYYLGRPADAFQVMRNLGLGISNGNLEQVRVRAGYGIQDRQEAITEEDATQETETTEETTSETATTTEEVINDEQTATSTEEVVVDETTATTTPAVCVFTAEYFNNTNLQSVPVLTREEAEINHEWAKDRPDPSIDKDGFSAKWIGSCDFEAGEYQFTLIFDDAMRLFVDNKEVFQSWKDNKREKTYYIPYTMTAGTHEIMVWYYEYELNATAKVSWEKI